MGSGFGAGRDVSDWYSLGAGWARELKGQKWIDASRK